MGDPVTLVAQWLEGLLIGWGLSAVLVNVIKTLIGVVVIASFVLIVDILLVWVEWAHLVWYSPSLMSSNY